MARPHKYREVLKKLRAYDKRFQEWKHRGKGSERILFHPDINGRKESYPIKHHGNATEIRVGSLLALINRFNLPKNFFD
jgi:hypothetical protein